MSANHSRIEELDQNILTLCTRINAATYELLVMIREFEERAGFVKWGLHNCAEWLAWRCDLSMSTSREKVRVARALKQLPLISTAFSTGELSYAKVRELTRVANPEDEAALLKFALRHTAVTVAERCRELRCGAETSIGTAEKAWANRSSSWSVRQADAFLNMVNEYLLGDAGETHSNDNYLVTVHVDQSALVGNKGRSALPIESVKRLCCDSHAVVITEDEKGEPLNIGRKTRIVPKGIERAVRARDKSCCTFPGCRNSRFLHAHHVEHWSNGGETSLENLMLLCTRHHTLVHEGGFRIEKDFRDEWYFARPDGIAVPEVGYLSVENQNPPAGGLLSAVEKQISEPPPPVYLH